MKQILFFLSIFLLIGTAAVNRAGAQTRDNSLKSKFDQVMAANFNKDGLGGVLLVAKNGAIIYENAMGKANVELNVPLSVSNVFRVGSLTKQFTAVAILQLMEKGQLNLDDDLTKFIPD